MSFTNNKSKMSSSTLSSVPRKVTKGEEVVKQPYKYYLVLDFEATCEKGVASYPHEIIEMPVVVVDSRDMKIKDKWQTYVRPVLNPKLTKFCTELTGITQETVDKAPVLEEALDQLDTWLRSYFGSDFEKPETFTFATDGPWDFRDFYWNHSIKHQQVVCPKKYPYFMRWINIRRVHTKSFKSLSDSNIKNMLKDLGLKFEGRPHSGIDDAVNIARILIGSMSRGTFATEIEFAPFGFCDPSIQQYHKTVVRLSKTPLKEQPFRYYVVIDFHCTCDNLQSNYEHEIIQLCCTVVDSSTLQTERWKSFVRPLINTTITKFASSITGVTQTDVNSAETLSSVMCDFHCWLEKNNFLSSSVFASDNSADFGKFYWNHAVEKQQRIDSSKYPKMKQWIDITGLYGRHIGTTKPQSLKKMMIGLSVSAIEKYDHSLCAADCLISLFTRGVVAEVVSTISEYKSSQETPSVGMTISGGFPKYYVALDFECTCEKDSHTFPHEIIDIGIAIIDNTTLEIVNTWRSFVRPVLFGGKLTDFCKSYTRVSQSDVDSASLLRDVLDNLKSWMLKHNYIDCHNNYFFTFVTDGPWHIRDFFWSHSVNHQNAVNASIHPYFHKWINIRRVFAKFHRSPQKNLSSMLTAVGLHREGSAHNALNDASSLAKLVIYLTRRKAVMTCDKI